MKAKDDFLLEQAYQKTKQSPNKQQHTQIKSLLEEYFAAAEQASVQNGAVSYGYLSGLLKGLATQLAFSSDPVMVLQNEIRYVKK